MRGTFTAPAARLPNVCAPSSASIGRGRGGDTEAVKPRGSQADPAWALKSALGGTSLLNCWCNGLFSPGIGKSSATGRRYSPQGRITGPSGRRHFYETAIRPGGFQRRAEARLILSSSL